MLQGRKKRRSDFPGQVNFALGQVKIEVQWPGGQVKLASVVLINDNFQSEVFSKLKTVRLVKH